MVNCRALSTKAKYMDNLQSSNFIPECVCPLKSMYTNEYSQKLLLDSQNSATIQMPINRRMHKFWYFHTVDFEVVMNKNKLPPYTKTKRNLTIGMMGKKSDTKECILYNSNYTKFEKRRNLSMLRDIKRVGSLRWW